MANVTPPDVYPLTQQWKFSITANGCSGTRVYLETTGNMGAGPTTVPLPRVGDSWDTEDYEFVTLKSIDITYLNDDENCGKMYVCNYDGTPYTEYAQQMDDTTLPKTVEVSGEFISYNPSYAKKPDWVSDGKEVDIPLYKIVTTATIRIYRTISDFDNYLNLVLTKTNKLNNATLWGYMKGMVMFQGCNFTEFKNKMGSKRWRGELIFVVRHVRNPAVTFKAGYDDDGWQFQPRELGQWDIPELAGILPYEYTSFAELWTTQPITEDDNQYNHIPSL